MDAYLISECENYLGERAKYIPVFTAWMPFLKVMRGRTSQYNCRLGMFMLSMTQLKQYAFPVYGPKTTLLSFDNNIDTLVGYAVTGMMPGDFSCRRNVVLISRTPAETRRPMIQIVAIRDLQVGDKVIGRRISSNSDRLRKLYELQYDFQICVGNIRDLLADPLSQARPQNFSVGLLSLPR